MKILQSSVFRAICAIAIGVLLFLFSLYYVYTERGSEKSLAVAILSMIESMVMCTLFFYTVVGTFAEWFFCHIIRS